MKDKEKQNFEVFAVPKQTAYVLRQSEIGKTENKEKQIEEIERMTKIIYNTSHYSKIMATEIATYNVRHNYKRVDKDSVVLSKEEYTELKFAKTLLELREETIKYLEDANIRYHETLTDVFNRWVETDKETGGFNLHYIYDLAHFYEIEIKE